MNDLIKPSEIVFDDVYKQRDRLRDAVALQVKRITELEARAEKAEAERNALVESTRKLRDEAYEQGKHEGGAATIERCAQGNSMSFPAQSLAGRAQELDRLREINRELVKALERLGSMEAFTLSHVIQNTFTGEELKARIDFARAALAKATEEPK